MESAFSNLFIIKMEILYRIKMVSGIILYKDAFLRSTIANNNFKDLRRFLYNYLVYMVRIIIQMVQVKVYGLINR